MSPQAAILLFSILFASHARAAAPDTFDPAKRDPAWISPRAKAAEARRRELRAREGDEWVGRCAAFLADKYRGFSAQRRALLANLETKEKKSPGRDVLDQWGEDERAAREFGKFGGDDANACNELEDRYFRPREDLHEAVFLRFFQDGRAHEARDAAQVLDEYARVHGAEAVAVLERHAGEFAVARHELDGGTHHLEAVGRAGTFEPAQKAESRAEQSIRNALAYVATPEVRDRYLDFKRRVALDPRVQALTAEGASSSGMGSPMVQALLPSQPAEAARAVVEGEAAEASGMSLPDSELFDLLLSRQRARRGELRVAADSPARKASDAAWATYREAIGDAAGDFFEREQEEIDRRVEGMKLAPRYLEWVGVTGLESSPGMERQELLGEGTSCRGAGGCPAPHEATLVLFIPPSKQGL